MFCCKVLETKTCAVSTLWAQKGKSSLSMYSNSQSHKYFTTEAGDFPTGQQDTGHCWKQDSDSDRCWPDPVYGGTPGNWHPDDHGVVSRTENTYMQLISKLTQWLSWNLWWCVHPSWISLTHWKCTLTLHFLTDKKSIFIISKLVLMPLPLPTIFSSHSPFWCTVESPNHNSVGYVCSLTRHLQTPESVCKESRVCQQTRLSQSCQIPLRKAAGFLLANITLLFTRLNADGKETGY